MEGIVRKPHRNHRCTVRTSRNAPQRSTSSVIALHLRPEECGECLDRLPDMPERLLCAFDAYRHRFETGPDGGVMEAPCHAGTLTT